jgi:hypothetical protein
MSMQTLMRHVNLRWSCSYHEMSRIFMIADHDIVCVHSHVRIGRGIDAILASDSCLETLSSFVVLPLCTTYLQPSFYRFKYTCNTIDEYRRHHVDGMTHDESSMTMMIMMMVVIVAKRMRIDVDRPSSAGVIFFGPKTFDRTWYVVPTFSAIFCDHSW